MHPKLKQLLHSASLPQSLLLIADSAEQLKTEALEYAHAFLGVPQLPHPDFSLIAPEGKSLQHSIEQVRTFKEEVYKPPFQSSRKLFVILEADRMPPVSANALLKAFEEPLFSSYILLCTTNPGRMLPTILSRCQKLKLDLVDTSVLLPAEAYQFFATLDQRGTLERIKQADFIAEWCENYATVPKVKGEDKDLSAQQKEQLEKEQDAAFASKVSMLLSAYLLEWTGWVRDLHLLKVQGNKEFLLHKKYENELVAQAKRGFSPSLENILKSVHQAKTSFERYTPLSTVLFDLWGDVVSSRNV